MRSALLSKQAVDSEVDSVFTTESFVTKTKRESTKVNLLRMFKNTTYNLYKFHIAYCDLQKLGNNNFWR